MTTQKQHKDKLFSKIFLQQQHRCIFCYICIMAAKEVKERETLHLRIKPELKEKATQVAEKKGLDLSSYVRMVLTEAVERDSK